MSDLDVLVPYAQRESALSIVERLGFHFYETDGHLMSSQEALELNLTHHYHLKGGIQDSVVLELHFRWLGTDDELFPIRDLEWFWTQTTIVQSGSQFTILLPEAHLLYLCAHAVLQHGEENTILRHYFDLHQLIKNTPVDWDKVIKQAAVLGWEYVVDRALFLAAKYFSTPVPATTFADLRKSRPKPRPSAVADRVVRIQSKGARWERTLIRLHQLSFFERIDLVRRIIFPPQSYMRFRYGLRPNRRVCFFYPYRWFDQGQEMIWALWKRLRIALGGRE